MFQSLKRLLFLHKHVHNMSVCMSCVHVYWWVSLCSLGEVKGGDHLSCFITLTLATGSLVNLELSEFQLDWLGSQPVFSQLCYTKVTCLLLLSDSDLVLCYFILYIRAFLEQDFFQFHSFLVKISRI